MATAVEPFSYVLAELSHEYISEFPHPDIVPKYLATVSDKTGVEILTSCSSLGMKGSWLSLTRAHSFLNEFLATYQSAEQCAVFTKQAKNGSRTDRLSKSSLSDDEDDAAIENFHDNTSSSAGPYKSGGEEVSDWLKWTAEVLPQIQRTRSKRASIFSEPKTAAQKVPEPFVLYANFQPPSDPTAPKLPTLGDIERVLKKVYEKDKFATSSPPTTHTHDKLTKDVEGCSGGDTEQSQNSDQCSREEKETGKQQACNPPDYQGGADSVVSASATETNGRNTDESNLPSASSLPEQLSHSSCSPDADTGQESDLSSDQNANTITNSNHSLQLHTADELRNSQESAQQGRTSEISTMEIPEALSSDVPACNNEEKLISSSSVSLNRVARRKGQPKKNKKSKDMIVQNALAADSKTARAERAAKRKAKSELFSGPETFLEVKKTKEIKRTRNIITKAKHDRVSKNQKHGRPSQAKSDTEDEKDYTCSECSYVARKRSHLREHKRRVHITKEFKCDKCGKVFGFGKDLKRHRTTHQRAENCCDICGKMYKGFRSLAEHKKTHADGYIKPTFPCEFCKKIFSTKYVLAYHIKSEHLGMKKTYICPTCGKSFSQKNSYLQHANVHMGIRPHQCDVCGKSFSYEKSLKEHKYMHDENKQFECPVCHKKFRQTSGVSIHMKIHKERKDYVCSACGKGFSQKQALVRHERIHGGEKPFTCGLCQRTFTDSSILRRHMILIHKKDPKKWREDTISNVARRTDFFISVVGENGEASSSDNSAKAKDDQVLPSTSADLGDDAELEHNRNEDDSFSFVPVGIGTSAVLVPASSTRMQVAVMQAVLTGEDNSLAAGCLPTLTADNHLQPPSLLQRSGSDERSTGLQVRFSSISPSSSQQQPAAESTQPLDMSAQGQIADQGQLHTQTPSLITPFTYGDQPHRLSASDLYPCDVVQGMTPGIPLQYSSLLNTTASVTGPYHSPAVMMHDALNSLSFQAGLISVSSASQSQEQPASCVQLPAQPPMQKSPHSPQGHC